ncbi:hypothetical protein HPMBJEAJ_00060 [Aeromonas phage avDM6]|nr:hypothetical protein HPMBJEAJ_00060 [Aeromonas phage avDM6]
MDLYVLKNKYTNRLAVIEICGRDVYLIDDDGNGLDCCVYAEMNLLDVQDALNGTHVDFYTEIDPDHYDVVKINIP